MILQTVILHGVSPEIVDLKEQELWNCLQHVSSVLHYGNVVLGAGQTEEKCREFLNERLGNYKKIKF
jgi:chaperonin GroEL (HSP60 family)